MVQLIRKVLLSTCLSTSLLTGLLTTAILATPSRARAAHFIQGSKEASVQMLIYGDLQCPFCARLWTYMDKFKADYGDKIGITFAQFPLSFHPEAMSSAINAECAAKQGKFFEFIDSIYKDQKSMNQQRYTAVAQQIGVRDLPAFAKCVSNPATQALVEADRESGRALSVQGTPYIYINGSLLKGVYPYEDFKKTIDAALKAAN